jgi:uncharacterized protein (TIGR02145 family)
MTKKLTLTLFLLILAIAGFCQSAGDLANAAYHKADEAYQKFEFQVCVDELKTAMSLLGGTNPQIQMLLAKAYYQLNQYELTRAQVWKYLFAYPPPEYDSLYRVMFDINRLTDEAILREKAQIDEEGVEEIKKNPDSSFREACLKCDEQLIRALLNYGTSASIRISREKGQTESSGPDSCPAIFHLIKNCPDISWPAREELVGLFLNNGADPNGVMQTDTNKSVCLRDKYLGEAILEELTDNNRQSVFSSLKLCIENRMDVNQDQGSLLRHLVLLPGNPDDCYEIIKYLLECGAKSGIEKRCDQNGEDSPEMATVGESFKSPLFLAKKQGKDDLVRLFKEYEHQYSQNTMGTFSDSRDGRIYKKVKIGAQTWMAENLAWLPAVTNAETGDEFKPYYYVYGYDGSDCDSAKARKNFQSYGVLYNWPAAVVSCPPGWHLPSDDEWTALTGYLEKNGYGFEGSGEDIGKSLSSDSGWRNSSDQGQAGNHQASNNRSGFNALPSGVMHSNDGFRYQGAYTMFWTSTGDDDMDAYACYLFFSGESLYRIDHHKMDGFSVRCVKNYSWKQKIISSETKKRNKN